MGKIETLEKEIENLSSEELTLFREWFAAFDAEIWDRQIENDVAEGKLDRLADEAIEAHPAKPQGRLDELLSRIKKRNPHDEVESGPVTGREVW